MSLQMQLQVQVTSPICDPSPTTMSKQVFEERYADITNPSPYDYSEIAIVLTSLLILLIILVNLLIRSTWRIFRALSTLYNALFPSQDRKQGPLGDPYAPSAGQRQRLDVPRSANKGLSGLLGRSIVPETPPAGIKVNVPRNTVPLKTYRQLLRQLDDTTENWRRVKEELEILKSGK